MSLDHDTDGYDADTSTPKMTPSDDMLLNPAYWQAHPEKRHMIRQRLLHHPHTLPPWPDDPKSTTEPKVITAPPRPNDPDSITESESDLPPPQTTAPPHVDNPDSITEPEMSPNLKVTHLPQVVTAPPHMDDLDSITEPESDPPKPSITITSTPKATIWKSIFTVPSPPPPGSIYWKYVTQEEDNAWYDRS
ncbi:uncharacterized protein BJ212DRAFT_1480040 [Suillus subaureus]|uniref:Uncharacterized protein n=1 Tax=Suillus subaureus TaxID=48587 RepID=A0A9P7EDN2_9AGAM|nr:uncharacterized protein BJ212DRAFT_1480040 [Suillus subaureus]KAG1818218.1 hypothetical protein BJ212DRAFT_1480040 [Suillus subaureus]